MLPKAAAAATPVFQLVRAYNYGLSFSCGLQKKVLISNEEEVKLKTEEGEKKKKHPDKVSKLSVTISDMTQPYILIFKTDRNREQNALKSEILFPHIVIQVMLFT